MADKKISELPLINTISGSIVFVPIVHDGITEKITVEDFSKFTNKYAAQTGSVNIFTANQTITANLSVGGTSTLTGNTSIGGNLVVNGKLTAQEVHTEVTSASIIFESGSTIFGNSAEDTHQFTGIVSINGTTIGAAAVNEFTASQLENDVRMLYITGALNAFTASQIGKDGTLAEVTSSLRFFYQTTSSLHEFTASQIGKDETLKVVTSSLNAFTASQIGKDGTLAEVTSSLRFFYQTTSSIHAFTASQIGKDGTLGLVTSSLNDFTQSQIGKDGTLAEVTSSLRYFYQTTSSIHAFTASQIGQVNTLSIFTSSINAFTGSQIGKDGTLAEVTSSLRFFYQTTSSLHAFTASQIGKDGTLAILTSSIDAHILKQATQTGSQDLVNLGISTYTGSNESWKAGVRGEVNGIESYTSSLKAAITVSGTNVQIIGDLNVNKLNVQYISSSVLVTSGSNIFGDASNDKHEFTGSVNIADTLFIKGVAQGTGELNAFTGSQIGKDFTLSVVTSSIDAHILKQATQTGSQDLVNLGISTYTGSQNVINSSVDAHILKQATQTGSQDLVNLGISTFTGSLRSEVNLIEAYTASLKGAAIVSSSQQIQNYFTFAQTSSANTFYGTQTFVNAETTFNYNPQTSLLAGYNYLNFGGGSIMYRNASDIYIGSNAKYGSAGTVVANYTSANGMGLLTMDGASLRYQATDASVTAGNAYGVPIRFAINGDGNVGVNTTAPVASLLTGSLTIRKSYNNDIASVPTTTGQSYWSNQSGLYLFGRNSGISIIGGNSEECTIVYGNQSTHRFASITAGTGTDAVGGDLYIKVGSDTERLRVAATGDGSVTVSTGNLVIGTSGKGIDFSATSNGSGTTSSELLNDYETGTWSPQVYYQNATDQTNSTNVTQVGTYTKIGNVVVASGVLQWTVTGSPANDNIGIKNFPFTSKSGGDNTWWGNLMIVNAGSYPTDGYILRYDQNATLALFYDSRSDTSNYGDEIGATGTKTARFTITYLSA